jgi:uncharacterized protein YdcH (DUF465 family)
MVARVASPDSSLLDRLDAQHRALDARLAELARHISLTTAEQVEYRQLKKQKLVTKDRMLALAPRR